jgi:ribose transport system permease protein
MSTVEAPTSEAAPPPALRFLRSLSGPVIGLIVVLALFIGLIGADPSPGKLGKFLSIDNLQIIAHEATIPAIVALGMLLVIVSGGIDLSVGSVVALVTVVTMRVYRELYDQSGVGTASAVAVASGIGVGGLCGLVNGLVVTWLRLPPFVATLGMFSVARGLAILLAHRKLLAFPVDSRPAWVDDLSRVHVWPWVFNPGFWSAVVLALVVAVLLRRTVFGRYVYAVGSNEATARLCGVPVRRVKLWVYTLAGLLAGWAGIIAFAHGSSGNPTGNEQLELDVIAAVVIGGASLLGGRGTVMGTILGVLILGVLNNGVSTYNVPVETKHILIGAIIVANTALSQWNSRSER